MNSVSEDIKDILVAESSLGLIFATNLFIGREPTAPINCVTIFDTPGFPPQFTLGKLQYEYPSIQIRVRNKTYVDGWAMIENIKAALQCRSQEVWNDTFYSIIQCSSGPALLDWDANQNPRFIINFNIQRR